MAGRSKNEDRARYRRGFCLHEPASAGQRGSWPSGTGTRRSSRAVDGPHRRRSRRVLLRRSSRSKDRHTRRIRSPGADRQRPIRSRAPLARHGETPARQPGPLLQPSDVCGRISPLGSGRPKAGAPGLQAHRCLPGPHTGLREHDVRGRDRGRTGHSGRLRPVRRAARSRRDTRRSSCTPGCRRSPSHRT